MVNHWEWSKYGEVIETALIKRDGKTLEMKVIRHKDILYCEFWYGAYCLYYGEMF